MPKFQLIRSTRTIGNVTLFASNFPPRCPRGGSGRSPGLCGRMHSHVLCRSIVRSNERNVWLNVFSSRVTFTLRQTISLQHSYMCKKARQTCRVRAATPCTAVQTAASVAAAAAAQACWPRPLPRRSLPTISSSREDSNRRPIC